MSKCNQAVCDKEATVEVFWPGKTLEMCRDCADKAERIGQAMGTIISTRPLP